MTANVAGEFDDVNSRFHGREQLTGIDISLPSIVDRRLSDGDPIKRSLQCLACYGAAIRFGG